MQFTIPRDTILPVLGALSRTARPNGPLPQLGFARVTATDGTLRLFATNLKWSVTHEVPCAGITCTLKHNFVGKRGYASFWAWRSYASPLRLESAGRRGRAPLPAAGSGRLSACLHDTDSNGNLFPYNVSLYASKSDIRRSYASQRRSPRRFSTDPRAYCRAHWTKLCFQPRRSYALRHITQPGQGAIPAKLVTDFVGQLPPEPLVCTWHPDTLRLDLACRGFQAQLPGWNPEELPAPPGAGATPLATLPAPTLRTLLESVAYAAADDATKVLSNVLFHFHDQQLTLVGADGFRLVRRSAPLETLTLPAGQECEDLQLLVPAAVAAELVAGLPEAKGSQETLVTLALTPDQHHLIVQALPKCERGARNAERHVAHGSLLIPSSHFRVPRSTGPAHRRELRRRYPP